MAGPRSKRSLEVYQTGRERMLCADCAYRGTHYLGWQRQSEKAESKRPSVQARVEEAVANALGYSVPVVACSRTDAGTHALQNVRIQMSHLGKQIRD